MQFNYISRKEHMSLVISSFRVVVANTDDEIYVSRTVKINSYFSFVSFTMPTEVELLKILKVI